MRSGLREGPIVDEIEGEHFQATWAVDARRLTLHVGGEFDYHAADRLLRVVPEFHRAWYIEIDLTEVTFIDSSAIAFLLGLRRSAVPVSFETRGSDIVNRAAELIGVAELLGLVTAPR